jgi:proteasome lid subunit RPN8/RPN11
MFEVKVPLLWRLPTAALEASIAEMAPDGARGCEGVALWLGHRVAGIVTITHVVGLRGRGIVRRPDHLAISAELLDDVTDLAIEHGVYLVGQIHSHPGAWVDLSDADKRWGIQAPGYLSVVMPHFARDPATPLGQFGFHVSANGGWRRLSPFERRWRVAIVNKAASLLLAGDAAHE